MNIEISNKPLSGIKADCEVVFVVNKNFKHKWVADKETLESLNFKGEGDECVLLAEAKKIYASIESLNRDEIRTASAKAIRAAKKTKFKSLKVGLYFEKGKEGESLSALAEGFWLGLYAHETYKSKKSEHKIEKIIISTEEYADKKEDIKKLESALNEAKSIAEAINMTREVVNTPPDDMTPIKLAHEAKSIAEKHKMECGVYDEKFLEKNGMNAFRAVSRASAHPPRLIHMIHKPKKPKAKIALVGKGLTYDSGGLSLKPSDYMVTMKADKGGGSAVLGIMRVIGELNLPFEVHGVIGATENMIGGNAYKPDDVLVAKNKKTIEVRNTDAEGRLVLADCLCYIQELGEFDYIIDLATLTGACVVALGEYTFGVMGFNDKLKKSILEASKNSGELSAELPFNKHLKKLLKSDVADMTNACSTRYGGAITAGLFLAEFIEDKNRDKWVHLDIAGPAFVEKEWGYHPAGASGVGIKTVIEWMKSLA